MKITILLFVLSIFVFANAELAADLIIESFEDTADPAIWSETSPDSQTHNAVNAAAPSSYVTEHVTHGVYAGRFEFNWVLPGATGLFRNYLIGVDTTNPFWTMRINVANQSNLITPSFSRYGAPLRADFYNNSPDPIQVSLYVNEGGTTSLERGPLVTLTPFAATTYSWDLNGVPPVAYITGNGAWDSETVGLRGIIVYTETAPTNGSFSMDVDNIRMTEYSPVMPPEAPLVYFAGQGSAPGKLKIRWKANTESDLAGYKIYLADDHNFGAPIPNRLNFPETPIASADASATSIEIDLPTTGPVYIKMVAYDMTYPSPLFSFSRPTLGAWLNADGSPPSDKVVLDLNRFAPGSVAFTTNGYAHRIVYNAHALADLNRHFESCSGEAIADGIVTLAPNSIGVVIYSNGQDGETVIGESLTDAVLAALTAFVNAGGNLFISGTSLGLDLQTNGTAAGKAFYANILKAGAPSSDSVAADGVIQESPFTTAGNYATGPNIYDVAAYGTTNNEGVTAAAGGTAVLTYDEAGSRKAGVIWGNRVVYFAFSHETVQNKTNATFAAARAKRAAPLGDVINYLTWAPSRCIDWEVYK